MTRCANAGTNAATPVYTKPELLATGPNEVWSWDITKLKGPVKGQFFNLYVILDIFSRCIVGWMLSERENAGLAARLIEQTYAKHGIRPGSLTLHADRGSPMTATSTQSCWSTLASPKAIHDRSNPTTIPIPRASSKR